MGIAYPGDWARASRFESFDPSATDATGHVPLNAI
jgi:hypothetical protein